MLVLCFLQIKIWSGRLCSWLRGGGNRNTKSNTSLSQGACASEVCAQSLSGKEDNDSDQTLYVSADELSETEGHGTSDSRSISCRSQEHATTLSLDPTPKPTLDAASTVEDSGIGDTPGMLSQQETYIMAKLLSVRPFNALLIGHEEPQQDLELPGVLSTADKVPTEIDTAASLIAAERAAAPHPTAAKGKSESPFPVRNRTKEQGEEVSKDCSSDAIPSAHPPDHNGNRADDSTDLIEGGGKKSKPWVLEPIPKPVDKHSKRLNIGDCLGLFTAEDGWTGKDARSYQGMSSVPAVETGAHAKSGTVAAAEAATVAGARTEAEAAADSHDSEEPKPTEGEKAKPNTVMPKTLTTSKEHGTKSTASPTLGACASEIRAQSISVGLSPQASGESSLEFTGYAQTAGKDNSESKVMASGRGRTNINHAPQKKRSESDLKSKSPSWPTFASSSQYRILAPGLPGAKSSPNLIYIGKHYAANEDSSPRMSRWDSMPALHSVSGEWSQVLKNVPSKCWPNVEKPTRVDTAVQYNSPFPVRNKTKEQGDEVSKDCSSDTIPSAHPPYHNGNRSDDSTDLLKGGGKKSKSWLLQPSPKPVDKRSKRLNIGDCLGLFTAEELIQGEHSLCERCAEVQRMHEINSQDQGEVTRVCVETAKTI